MKNRDRIVLIKILKYCKQIDEASVHFDNSFEEFKTSSVYQNACCMCILQIGELCKLLSMEFRSAEPGVPWRRWCGIRDIMAHQYEELDVEIAWDTIQEDIPVLSDRVNGILEKLNTED